MDCEYHKGQGTKWTQFCTQFFMWNLAKTSLLCLFSLFFVQKCHFLHVLNFSSWKYQFLVNLSIFSWTYRIFPGLGWSFPVNVFEKEFFQRKMSSLAGRNENSSTFPRRYCFRPFLTTLVQLQSQFCQRTVNITKYPLLFLWRKLLEKVCEVWAPCLSCGG